jgi:hypothetical protein
MDAPTISSFSTQQQPPTGNVGGSSTNGQALALGSVDDLFAQLKEFQWKGVSFPSVEDELEIRQDLVIHRFADRNGAYVEGTGRHPIQITARIPFLNHIYNATNETWPQGALYPYQWRLFILQCLEGTSGVLQHPELGPLNCKIDLAKTSWSGKVRGGVWVQATWVESDDTQADQLGVDLSAPSPIAQLTATADDLDENIQTLAAALGAQANPLPALEFTFSDLAASLVGVSDTTTILKKQYQGRIDNVLYQCDRVETSLSMAASNAALGPLSWPLYQDCERQKDAAYTVQQQAAIAQKRPLNQTQLPKDATLAGAALYVGADITDFITLNYALVSTPVIPAGTTVLYYSQEAA